MFFDWRKFQASNAESPAVVDPRRRMAICFGCFTAAALLVFGRVVQLEVSHGAAFREEALRPIEREVELPAARGRILADDGTVLARDREIDALAVDYRLLQEPPGERWLRAAVNARLSKADRKDAEKVAAARSEVLAERGANADKLARLCGMSPGQWAARSRKIQARVERISTEVNRRARAEAARPCVRGDSWAARLCRLLLDDPPRPRIVVKEELRHHIMAEDIPPESAAEIAGNPEVYPGARIERIARRQYEHGSMAAHVVGHLGLGENGETVGLMGVERQCESILRGADGAAVEQIGRDRRVIASHVVRQPQSGRDVVLTIVPPLQRASEELLLAAIKRAQNDFLANNITIKRGENDFIAKNSSAPLSFGGAAAVMDVHNGELLAAASAPAFDPNLFITGDDEAIGSLLAERSHPLFNRVVQMAIPPGSTFKIVTAAALLESAATGPGEPFHCRGYLHSPDRQRCELFVRRGIGHGEVTLAEAIAVSCNVYFFHFAGSMGGRPLVDWAERFGFGRPTGVDLPGEAAGSLPTPENLGELQSAAIGQGALTATPLQVLRMTAAVANGGRLLRPSVVKQGRVAGGQGRENQDAAHDHSPSAPFLSQGALNTIRRGLERVVADPRGTAHGTVFIESIPIAGKTGTAETGGDRPGHAWFAGYVPADAPKYAFVIVLEHAGDASSTAGPVAKRLVLRMWELGML